MKKAMTAAGVTLLLSFNFLGIEYLLYGLKIEENVLFYPALALLLLTVLLVSKGLRKLELVPGGLSDWLVAAAVFLGLGALKLFL